MGIIQEVIKGMGDQIITIIEGETLGIKITIETGAGHMNRQNRDRRDSRSISNSRSWSGSRVTTNRDRIRCFECREYDHFARDCPTRQASREAEQIQQMFNMDEGSDNITNPTDGHRSRQTDYKPSRDQRQFKLVEGKNDSTDIFAFRFKIRWK